MYWSAGQESGDCAGQGHVQSGGPAVHVAQHDHDLRAGEDRRSCPLFHAIS